MDQLERKRRSFLLLQKVTDQLRNRDAELPGDSRSGGVGSPGWMDGSKREPGTFCSRSSSAGTASAPLLGLNASELGEKSISERGQIRRRITQSFPDSIQQSSGRQIEIKAQRSAVRHHQIIQLTPKDPVIRETAGNGRRLTGKDEKGRNRKKNPRKETERRDGLPAEDNKDGGRRPADLHMDGIPGPRL